MALNPHKTLTGIIIGRKVLDQRCSILSVSISGEANGQRSKMRLSEYKRELVLILSSVSILSNGQCSMVKNAIKREQSQACLDYAEREHFRRSQWSMFNGQKCD